VQSVRGNGVVVRFDDQQIVEAGAGLARRVAGRPGDPGRCVGYNGIDRPDGPCDPGPEMRAVRKSVDPR